MDTDVERGTTLELYNEVEETVDPAQQQQVEYEPDIEKGGPADVLSGKIIRKLDQAPRQFRKNYIFRVDDIIRKGHENHYEPILFAFGPYHRGKSKLQPMEEHKWQCLNGMIERVTKQNCISRSDLINRCCEMLKGLEDEARGYYADDTTGLDSGKFLEMLLVDGCFLLETLCKNHSVVDDPLMKMAQIERILLHDLLLLENQLPFFILEKLHDVMITNGNDEKGSSVLLLSAIKCIFFFAAHSIRSPARAFQDYMRTMISVSKLYGNKYEDLVNSSSEGVKQFLTDLAAQEKGREIDPEKLKNTKHLLELIYKALLKEDLLDIVPEDTSTTSQAVSADASSIFDILNESRYNTYTVTELSNAGVKFKPVDEQKFYCIQFKNSTLEIPKITIIICGA